MTKKDFFILAIKLFGLMSIVTSFFSGILNNISYALFKVDTLAIIWIAAAIVISIGLFVLLVFKADKIVSLLKLEKGFDDEKIELGNLNASEILKVGTFIIGGLLFIHNIPIFLSHILFAYKSSVMGKAYDSEDNFYWAVSVINIILGYLLMTNYSFVTRLLRTNDKESE